MWITLSILAGVFYALRFIVLKKYLSSTDTLLIGFAARFSGFLFLLPLAIFFPLTNFTSPLFWQIIAITVVVTGAATLLQIHAIRHYDISSSIPFLAFVPLFMLLAVFLIFKEVPTFSCLLGVVILCLGAFTVNFNARSPLASLIKEKGAWLFLIVAVLLGFTTTLDRVAITTAQSGGFTYTFFWHAVSTVVFLSIFFNPAKSRGYLIELKSKAVVFALQGLLGVLAFLLQMWAVQTACNIAANVIYIKALTMLQLLFGVVFGIVVFKEKNAARRVLGTVLMLVGAAVIVIMNAAGK